MALSRPMTLGEIRQEVQIRCGLGTTGTLPEDQQALVDSKIRSAQRMLFTQSWWTRQLTRFDVPLTADVSDYDWPDTLAPENLSEIVVVRLTDGKEYPLEPGTRPNERNSAALSSGAPVRYDFVDGNLRVYPAPDANWSKITLWGYGDVPPFVDDGELAVVEGEALMQFAEKLVKEHYGMPGTRELGTQLDQYLLDLRARQSNKSGISLTGRQSLLLKPIPDNRVTRQPNSGSWQDWHPWGD